MNEQELIEKYNPANAAALNDADLEYMRKLTDDQISVLAKAYPNTAQRQPYLLLWDTKVTDPKRQLYAPSTWQNLNNVRKYSGLKNLIPYTFKVLHTPQRAAGKPGQGKAVQGKRPVVHVDMSAAQAAEELKKTIASRTTKSTEKQAPTKVATKTAGTQQGTAKAQTGAATAKAKPTETTQDLPPAKVVEGDQDASEEFTDGGTAE